MGEFGDKFRKAREKKEISLDDVSNVTKISARMLRAIEEEHFDQLPGGVFNKGFIRAYAKHLGLNDEEAVTDYLACLRQAQIDAHEVWEPEASTKTNSTQRQSPERNRLVEPNLISGKKSSEKSQSPVQVEELPELQLPRAEHVRPAQNNFPSKSEREIPWNILAITAIVVVLAAILWIRRSHTIGKAALNPAPAMLQTPTSAPVVPAPVPKVPVQNEGQQTNLAPANTVAAHGPKAAAPTTASTNSSVSATVKSSDTLAGSNDRAVKSGTNEQNAAPAPVARQAAPAAKTDAPLKLLIRAEETSWISVLADGQTVSRETLIAPAHASIRATREIVVKIGNAAGVTFLWNGQEIPANGSEGEVKTFIFDANGMRAGAPAPSPTQNP